jgi:hypothetical protein
MFETYFTDYFVDESEFFSIYYCFRDVIIELNEKKKKQ